MISFYFPLFKQSGINYPPTSSVPLSFKKGASFLMLSFNQLSHSYPLHRGKGATCYRYSQSLTYSILLSTIRQQRPSRDEWVLPDSKTAPELYKVVRPGAIFFGISQSPRPAIISRQAGMDGLSRMEKCPLDCTQTVRSGRFLSRNKIWATRTGPILISRQAGMNGLFRVEKCPLGCTK